MQGRIRLHEPGFFRCQVGFARCQFAEEAKVRALDCAVFSILSRRATCQDIPRGEQISLRGRRGYKTFRLHEIKQHKSIMHIEQDERFLFGCHVIDKERLDRGLSHLEVGAMMIVLTVLWSATRMPEKQFTFDVDTSLRPHVYTVSQVSRLKRLL